MTIRCWPDLIWMPCPKRPVDIDPTTIDMGPESILRVIRCIEISSDKPLRRVSTRLHTDLTVLVSATDYQSAQKRIRWRCIAPRNFSSRWPLKILPLNQFRPHRSSVRW